MMDEVWKRNEIDSPCVKICVVHPEARLCIGCHRTIDEIAQWSKMSDADRARVKAELPSRASQLRGKRRGRKRE
ncbi:MAG: DUF1289 domain-containing protein [Rhodobacteraceae bacterium]|nr:DUF1289 domain-containing protein [Paracoccaceae bacterium]